MSGKKKSGTGAPGNTSAELDKVAREIKKLEELRNKNKISQEEYLSKVAELSAKMCKLTDEMYTEEMGELIVEDIGKEIERVQKAQEELLNLSEKNKISPQEFLQRMNELQAKMGQLMVKSMSQTPSGMSQMPRGMPATSTEMPGTASATPTGPPVTCPKCGSPTFGKFCNSCGGSLEQAMGVGCNTSNASGVKLCNGADINTDIERIQKALEEQNKLFEEKKISYLEFMQKTGGIMAKMNELSMKAMSQMPDGTLPMDLDMSAMTIGMSGMTPAMPTGPPVTCPKCGNPASGKFCNGCGADIGKKKTDKKVKGDKGKKKGG